MVKYKEKEVSEFKLSDKGIRWECKNLFYEEDVKLFIQKIKEDLKKEFGSDLSFEGKRAWADVVDEIVDKWGGL